jgi:nitroreductase
MNEVIENILSRRSIRKYTKEQIKEEDLNLILDAARFAPNGGNSQSWHFIVVQSDEKLQKLNTIIKEAFVNLEVDENTYKSLKVGKITSKSDNYSFNYNAPTLIIVTNLRDGYKNAMADSAAAIENMFLAAHSLGLGSCWINQMFWFGENEIMRKTLVEMGMPETDKVYGSVALGYNDGGNPNPQKRKEGTIIRVK